MHRTGYGNYWHEVAETGCYDRAGEPGIPFVIALLVFPIRGSERPLFESIMAVAVTFAVMIAAIRYFREVHQDFVKEGMMLGMVWLAINIGIDLVMFMQGPMKMAFPDYLKDIGVTYLIIPVITIGTGFLAAAEKKKQTGVNDFRNSPEELSRCHSPVYLRMRRPCRIFLHSLPSFL